MVLLQQIKRNNGSYVHSLNIPLEEIEATEWKKGEELLVQREEIHPGVFILHIIKEEDRKYLGG